MMIESWNQGTLNLSGECGRCRRYRDYVVIFFPGHSIPGAQASDKRGNLFALIGSWIEIEKKLVQIGVPVNGRSYCRLLLVLGIDLLPYRRKNPEASKRGPVKLYLERVLQECETG